MWICWEHLGTYMYTIIYKNNHTHTHTRTYVYIYIYTYVYMYLKLQKTWDIRIVYHGNIVGF